MLVSIVIPCYNSEKTIRKVTEMVMAEFAAHPRYTCDFFLVNDYSKDNTFEEIRRLAEDYENVHGINLMRNFGQHNALMAALNYADGDYVLGMDDDMQTHPSQVFLLLDKISEGYDLVYGKYEKKENGLFKNMTSKFNEVTSRILLGRPRDIVSSNFWVITRAVRDEVILYKNFNPYVDGIFYRTTSNIANVSVEHHKREYGSSNYTLKKLMNLWLAYFNYSVIPLRISSFMGSIFSAVGGIFAIVILIWKLLDPTMVAGWASIICIQLFFSGIIMLILGILGEYIGKLILAVNGSPQYIVRETVNIRKEDGGRPAGSVKHGEDAGK
ncbi:MAG: glycosyltransferase [Lachnospiraceae bacterium]|nr:glycosyltransferase [Lachnospiraceae bacterium]